MEDNHKHSHGDGNSPKTNTSPKSANKSRFNVEESQTKIKIHYKPRKNSEDKPKKDKTLLKLFIIKFTKMISTTKGRDKICALIQYSAKMIYYCQIYSNIPEISKLYKDREFAKTLYSGRLMKQ